MQKHVLCTSPTMFLQLKRELVKYVQNLSYFNQPPF